MTAPGPHNRFPPGHAPVTDHEADALDAWLESVTALGHVERNRNISPNGHVDPGTSLHAAAEGFHTQLVNAEHRSGPDVPVDLIWEKIMASNTIAAARPQPNTPRGAAKLVSARVPRRDHAWLSGSHWAVNTFMLAAVVVGIVALYGSFAGSPGSNDDPANPNFAMASPGETFTTPEPDIDRWLVDPATIDCERDPDGTVDSSEWATNRPTMLNDYLPFASAAASDADVIADRWFYFNAGCAPTAADPLVTDDFGWMPGVGGGVIPTDEQIALAKEISAALPMQNYQSYYIVREPSPEATPNANDELNGRGVLLPEDMVQLPDGRLAGPLRFVIETNDPDFTITDYTEGYEAAGTPFLVFQQVDGRWLYDELITLCIGDCDWFWTEIANPDAVSGTTTHATPAESTPSVSVDWLQPYTPDECVVEPRTLDDVAAFMQDPGEWPPRQYGPVEPVSEDLAREVATANRVFQSCDLTGETGEWRAMVSPRLIFEGKGSPYVDSISSQSATYGEFVATSQQLSEMLLTDPARDYTVESTQAIPLRDGGLPNYSASEIFWSVILPDDLVMLPDGRIGGPELSLLPANHEEYQQAVNEIRLATPTPLEYEMVSYRIFVQDPAQDGQWVLDETLTLCASGCDAFYADAEEFYQSNVPIAPATPVSATPSTGTDWLAPIAPDECDVAETRALEEVGTITQNPDLIVPREYLPVTEVEVPLAQDVASANRAWEACRAQGLIGERRAHETLRHVAEIEPYNVVAPLNADSYDDWVALNETLRAAFLDPATASYLVESEALPPFDCETGYGEADQSGEIFYEVIQPQHLVQLPDGRIGGPVTSLVGPGFLQCFEARPPAMSSGYELASIHIFAQDPTRDNRWALDERFSICVTGCDDYYEETAFLSYYLYPPWPATPGAATPATDAAALQPILPEECDIEALSTEEISSITEGSGEEAERSYAPVGPVHDALAQEVAGADRAWQSCYVYGTAGERAALQSPRLTRDGPGVPPGMGTSREDVVAELDQFDATRELGELMLTGDWRDYFVESDLFNEATPAPYQVTDFIPTIPIPNQAFHVADGRIAIPIARLVPPDAYASIQEAAGDDAYWSVPVHILVQEPALGDRWVVDETIDLCVDNCDLARTQIVEYIDYLDSLAADPDDATPAATPQAKREHPVA